MSARDALRVAWERLSRTGRGASTSSLHDEMRAVLDAFEDAIERESKRPMIWILAPTVDRQAFVESLVQIAERRLSDARAADWYGALDCSTPECGCRCRKHQRMACPECVTVERCQRHTSPEMRSHGSSR